MPTSQIAGDLAKKQDNSLESFKVNKDGPKSLQVSATRPEEYRVGITDWQPKYSPRRWIPFEKLFEIVQNCLLVTTKAAENGALRVWQLPGELGGTGSALSRTLMIENEQSVSCSLKKALHTIRIGQIVLRNIDFGPGVVGSLVLQTESSG